MHNRYPSESSLRHLRERRRLKVRAIENNWNSRNPRASRGSYTPDSYWRNRSEFLHGREEIIAFLTRKWATELEYRLIKESGPSAITELRFALPMSRVMTRASDGIGTLGLTAKAAE